MYYTKKDKNGKLRYMKRVGKQVRFVSEKEFNEQKKREEFVNTEQNGVSIQGGPEGSVPPEPVKPKTETPKEQPKLRVPDRQCIFTGEKGPHLMQRFVMGQTVYLSEEMYHSKTIGEIAEQLRRINAKEEKIPAQV